MIAIFSTVALTFALVPGLLFCWNLVLYRRLPAGDCVRRSCSVLIPARNEEANIAGAIRSVRDSEGIEFEIIVLDDESSDGTAGIVTEIRRRDSRVRLESGSRLKPGWSGKNQACQQLAGLARYPLLVFMDADVRLLRKDSLARIARFVEVSNASLVSGVPRQETRSFLEKLIVPLIHFILLGFLPVWQMRRSTHPRFAAACGQIVAVRRDAYDRCGGHAAIADRMHDAVALARVFRAQGLRTDLFDATDTFSCRMYRRASEVWGGFTKNAHEALAAPRMILPSTLFLLCGQVLPVAILLIAPSGIALSAALAAFAPRLLCAVRFRQSLTGALLHPVGICVLIAMQWFAFARSIRREPTAWKGREYPATQVT